MRSVPAWAGPCDERLRRRRAGEAWSPQREELGGGAIEDTASSPALPCAPHSPATLAQTPDVWALMISQQQGCRSAPPAPCAGPAAGVSCWAMLLSCCLCLMCIPSYVSRGCFSGVFNPVHCAAPGLCWHACQVQEWTPVSSAFPCFPGRQATQCPLYL